MDVNDLTLGQIKEIRSLLAAPDQPPHPYKIGENYQFRLVTHILTGRLLAVYPQELVITDAAWIADTGRYSQAVASGDYNEVEPYPDGKEIPIGRAALIDACTIPSLPRKQK